MSAPRPPPVLPGSLSSTDIILVCNHFGISEQSLFDSLIDSPSLIIEDHTHDPWSPWSFGSRASYCFSSLRKTLPLPDGSVIWSPSSFRFLPPLI